MSGYYFVSVAVFLRFWGSPLALAVVSLLGDADLLTGFSDGDTLADMDLDFPELVDDLLRSIGSSDHFIPLSNPSTNIITGLVFRGQVTSAMKGI